MGIMEQFTDWQKLTGDMEELSITNDANGQPVEAWTAVEASVSFAAYIERAIETNTNDQFQNDEIGRIVIDYNDITTTPTNNMRVNVSGTIYDIVGVDDIGNMNEAWLLTYRKARK